MFMIMKRREDFMQRGAESFVWLQICPEEEDLAAVPYAESVFTDCAAGGISE